MSWRHPLDELPEFVLDQRSQTDIFEDEMIEDEYFNVHTDCLDMIANEFDISSDSAGIVVSNLLLRLGNIQISDEQKCDRIMRFLRNNEDVMDIIYRLDDGVPNTVPVLLGLIRQFRQLSQQRPI